MLGTGITGRLNSLVVSVFREGESLKFQPKMIPTLNHLISVHIIIFLGDGGDCQGGSSNN